MVLKRALQEIWELGSLIHSFSIIKYQSFIKTEIELQEPWVNLNGMTHEGKIIIFTGVEYMEINKKNN